MPTTEINRRLERLERGGDRPGACPQCGGHYVPRLHYVTVEEDGTRTEEGPPPPANCPACGRPADAKLIRVIEIVVPPRESDDPPTG